HCIYCKPPGLPLYMAEWAVSSARFKLKGGQPPPTLGRIQKQAVPPRWEREAIPDGRASASSGVSARDEEARSVSGGGRSGGANEPPRVRSMEGAVEGFHRRLGANERCNQCTGCLLPNCGKCWGCQHRVEYGGSGQRNQPCVDRWCRTKAAQRESDKLDKAARRKRAMAVGVSGVGTKRPLESSGEDYEGDFGGGDVFADKRFRRRTAKGTAAAAAAAAAGRTSPTPTGTALSGGDYSGLSYVFAGEGEGDGGGGLPRPNHEAAHVSAESAGIVLSAVGGGVGGASSYSSSRARPSSRSRRSGLKNLLGKGYRCLALLEELGARPLLNAAGEVLRDGAGMGDGLVWCKESGRLVLKKDVRKRLAAVDPFHEVPEIEMTTSLEPLAKVTPLAETDGVYGAPRNPFAAAAAAVAAGGKTTPPPTAAPPVAAGELAAAVPAADGGAEAAVAEEAVAESGARGASLAAAATPAAAVNAGATGDKGGAGGGEAVEGGDGKRNRETSVGAASASGPGSGSGSGSAVSASGSGVGVGGKRNRETSVGPATASGSGSGSGSVSASVSASGSAESPKAAAEGKKSSGEIDKGAIEGKDGKDGKGAGKSGAGSASAAAAAVRSSDSKYLGVRKQGSRWVAYIIRPSVGGETNLGVFDEEVDAAKQYDKYANMWLKTPEVNFPRGRSASRSRGGENTTTTTSTSRGAPPKPSPRVAGGGGGVDDAMDVDGAAAAPEGVEGTSGPPADPQPSTKTT
ncbi:unnamed protein product, partial [Ectocarpus sp. 12 AP-2014]